MEAWPGVLPQAPFYQYNGAQSSGLLDPEETLYPVRTRTYPEHTRQFIFRQLTVSQFQAFRAWWDATLNQCAPFTAPWLATIGLDHHFCRFDTEQPWEAAMNGKRIDLTINVEVIATMPVEAGLNAWYPPEITALLPVVDFAADVIVGNMPLSATFTAFRESGGDAVSYQWDFGDGSAGSATNPATHVYTAYGVYTVSVVATNAAGDYVATKMGYITVWPSVTIPMDISLPEETAIVALLSSGGAGSLTLALPAAPMATAQVPPPITPMTLEVIGLPGEAPIIVAPPPVAAVSLAVSLPEISITAEIQP